MMAYMPMWNITEFTGESAAVLMFSVFVYLLYLKKSVYCVNFTVNALCVCVQYIDRMQKRKIVIVLCDTANLYL